MGYGVVDSISGFEPLDLGSNPGTLAGFGFQSGYGVVDIMTVCGTVDPGSNPGTLAIQEGDKMKIETKAKQKTSVQNRRKNHFNKRNRSIL